MKLLKECLVLLPSCLYHISLCHNKRFCLHEKLSFKPIIAILLTLRRLDLGGIKRNAVSTKRIWMICVRGKKARPCHRVITDKLHIQDIGWARYTPRILIATAFYFDRTCWIVRIGYFYVVIRTIAWTIFQIEVKKVQVNVVARCCSNRPKAVEVMWVKRWMIWTREISLRICQVVHTWSWVKEECSMRRSLKKKLTRNSWGFSFSPGANDHIKAIVTLLKGRGKKSV